MYISLAWIRQRDSQPDILLCIVSAEDGVILACGFWMCLLMAVRNHCDPNVDCEHFAHHLFITLLYDTNVMLCHCDMSDCDQACLCIPFPTLYNAWWCLSYAAWATSHVARYSCHLAFAGFESKEHYGSATTTCKSFESHADPTSITTTNTICYTIITTWNTSTTTTTTNPISTETQLPPRRIQHRHVPSKSKQKVLLISQVLSIIAEASVDSCCHRLLPCPLTNRVRTK